MKAAVLKDKKDLVLVDREIPVPGEGEVLIRVEVCGICFTDYAAYSGKRNNYEPPVVLGHEFSGVVEDTGDSVTGVKIGDEVIVSPAAFCGRCRDCRTSNEHYCSDGAVIGGDGFDKFYDGAFAEYTVVPDSTLYKMPNNISFEEGALTEPLAGSYKGMIEKSDLKVGEDVVIIGAGSMGNLLVQVASAAGAGNIIAVDISDHKLKFAKESGATDILNSTELDELR